VGGARARGGGEPAPQHRQRRDDRTGRMASPERRGDERLDTRCEGRSAPARPGTRTPHPRRCPLMTIYPLSFHLGPITITGYGIMMMVAFLMAAWAIQVDLERRGMNQDYAADIIFAAVVGGIIGAKIWYVLLTGEWDALFRRGGFVWYGGFLGGVAVVLAGTERFFIEMVRAKDDRLLGSFTLAQLTSILLIVAGVIVMQRLRDPEPAPATAPAVLRGTTAVDPARSG